MTVGELRQALEGIPDSAVVNVSVTYSWDGLSGDALGAEALEADWDGPGAGYPDSDRAKANSFTIITEVPFSKVLKAAR
jgi:hypothetical protein